MTHRIELFVGAILVGRVLYRMTWRETWRLAVDVVRAEGRCPCQTTRDHGPHIPSCPWVDSGFDPAAGCR